MTSLDLFFNIVDLVFFIGILVEVINIRELLKRSDR